MITISDKALGHFKKILAKAPGTVAVRMAVRPSGCSGYAYHTHCVESILPEDTLIEMQGIKVVVDAKSAPFLAGMHVDLRREGLNEIVHFDNPNAKNACGCGESFNLGE